MSSKRNGSIMMVCPWLSETNTKLTNCIREMCPYYDLDIRTVMVNGTGGTKSYTLQSCRRAEQQSIELEIVANIFRELKNLLKEELK